MDSPELVAAVMKEVKREATKSRLSEKAREQAKLPRRSLLVNSIRFLPLPSFHTAPAY